MATIHERLRAYGAPLREITTLKRHKVRYYEEDEIVLLLDALKSQGVALTTLQATIQQFENRSKDYLEIYRVLNANVAELETTVKDLVGVAQDSSYGRHYLRTHYPTLKQKGE